MLKPNRLVYENPDTPPAAVAEKAEPKPTPLPEEVKKKHEEHRKAVQSILEKGLDSKNKKVRTAAASYMIKLEKLSIGYLTKATKEHFLAKYNIVIEKHEGGDKPSEENRKNLRHDLATHATSSNQEVSSAAAKATQELNQDKYKKMTEAEAAEFLAKYQVIFEYHQKNEEAQKVIDNIKSGPKELKDDIKAKAKEYQKKQIENHSMLTKEDKEAIKEAIEKGVSDSEKDIDAVLVGTTKPTVSLAEYQADPSKLTSKVAKLKEDSGPYARKITDVAQKSVDSIKGNAQAIILDRVSHSPDDSIKEIDKMSKEAINKLDKSHTEVKKKIEQWAKNAKALINYMTGNLDAKSKQQVRAGILCELGDNIEQEIRMAKSGKETEKPAYNNLNALVKRYNTTLSGFEKFPVGKSNPELKKRANKEVLLKEKVILFTEAGLNTFALQPNKEKIYLSDDKVYKLQKKGKAVKEYVKVAVGTPNGASGFILKNTIA